MWWSGVRVTKALSLLKCLSTLPEANMTPNQIRTVVGVCLLEGVKTHMLRPEPFASRYTSSMSLGMNMHILYISMYRKPTGLYIYTYIYISTYLSLSFSSSSSHCYTPSKGEGWGKAPCRQYLSLSLSISLSLTHAISHMSPRRWHLQQLQAFQEGRPLTSNALECHSARTGLVCRD